MEKQSDNSSRDLAQAAGGSRGGGSEFVPGPYSVAMIPSVEIGGVQHDPNRMWRDNDGSLIIMAGADEGDRQRIGCVNPITFRPKRGEGYRMAPEDDPAQLATARLWAAAPDLYAALKALADAHLGQIEGEGFDEEHCDCPVLDAARAAIAKARGQ